jgi:hypothetical protein
VQQQVPWPIYLCGLVVAYFIIKTLLYIKRKNQLIEKYGHEIAIKILSRRVWQGMTIEQLRDSWGNPVDIDREVYKTKIKETWKYNQTGKNRFSDRIYLNDGIVVGWKD